MGWCGNGLRNVYGIDIGFEFVGACISNGSCLGMPSFTTVHIRAWSINHAYREIFAGEKS